jgi:predicted nucleotidyltransferase
MIELGTDVANELTWMVTGVLLVEKGWDVGEVVRRWERGRADKGTEQETEKARKKSGNVPVDVLGNFSSIYAPLAAPVVYRLKVY